MPNPILRADLCILGGGAAGLSAAAGAAQLGLSVIVIESRALGGDCLHTGCAPSKALLASAARAQAVREAAAFGIQVSAPQIDFTAVMQRMRQIQADMSHHDGADRFRRLGCQVLYGRGRFVGRWMIAVDTADGTSQQVIFRRALIATGSSPVWPWGEAPVRQTRLLTTDSLFSLSSCPENLLIVGGGPIGCEMAQAFCRLGAAVTVIAPTILPAEDPDLVAPLVQALRREGVRLELGQKVTQAVQEGAGVRVTLADGAMRTGSHLLVATGRKPQVAGLALAVAEIACDEDGIPWHDGAFRTSNHRVYVAGDVSRGNPSFSPVAGGFLSHLAGAQAATVLRRAVFALPARAPVVVPRVVYGSPELAQVGLTADQARAKGDQAVQVIDLRMQDLGRWKTDHTALASARASPEGLTRVVIGRRGRVLGAGVVGPHAGELIGLWTAAVAGKLSLADLAGLILPYPTLSESIKQAAGAYYAPRLFSPWGRRVARWMMALGDLRR